MGLDLEDEVIEHLLRLGTQDLDPSFVQNALDVDFAQASCYSQTDHDDTSLQNAIPCIDTVLSKTVASCRSLAFYRETRRDPASTDHDSSLTNRSQFWNKLLDRGITIEKLLAFIYGNIQKGNKKDASFHDREVGFLSVSLYFALVGMQGSFAYRVFHPSLFQCALASLEIDFQNNTAPKRQGRQKSARCRGKRKRTNIDDHGCSSSQRGSSDSACSGVDQEFDNHDSDEENSRMLWSYTDIRKARNLLVVAIQDLVMCIRHASFGSKVEVVENLVQTLSKFTIEEESLDMPFEQMDNEHIAKSSRNLGLMTLAYFGLKILCQPQHGQVQLIFLSIGKYLLPSIVMSHISNSSSISKRYLTIKERSMDFLIHLISSMQEALLPAAMILIKNVCARAIDKAEFRSQVALEVVKCLKILPTPEYLKILQWLHDFSRSAKMSHRMLAVEVFFNLLHEPERETGGDNPAVMHSQKFLLSVIVWRCSDCMSSVCTKALNLLAACLSSQNPEVRALCENFLASCSHARGVRAGRCSSVPRHNKDGNDEAGSDVSEKVENGNGSSSDEDENPDERETLPCRCKLEEILLQRCKDKKVHVRKAAVQLLENVACLEREFSSWKLLQAVAVRCLDPAILVRKQALQSLTHILETFPTCGILQRKWAENVLPMVLDTEVMVQEKCLEVLSSVLLTNLENNHSGQRRELAWKILGYIAISNDQELQRYLQKTISLWVKNGSIRSRYYSVLKDEAGTQHDSAFWLLVSQMCLYCPIPNPSFVLEYWKQCSENIESIPLYTVQRVLQVLGASAKNVSKPDLTTFKDALEKQVKKFCFPVELVSTAIQTLMETCRVLLTARQTEKEIFTPLFKSCAHYLSSVAVESSLKTEEDFEEKTVRHIVTLGMVVQHYPKKVNNDIFVTILGLVLPSSSAFSRGSEEPASSDLPQVSQTPLDTSTLLSDRVRAHAYVTLGKICLQNEDLAKKAVPIMAREIETTGSEIVRNNICIIFADLCMHYTMIIDPYISQLTRCLKDPSLRVRHTVLTVLTQLLQEDYVKWKDTLYFRMLFTLVDKDKKIRGLADYSIGYFLKRRHPDLFYQHFIECIFYFNCYENEEAIKMQPRAQWDLELFCLKGPQYRSRRIYLYKFMLENMTDEHKFSLLAKLCGNVLGAFANQVIPLNNDTQEIMQDTFYVCTCNEIKLSSLQASASDDCDEGEGQRIVAAAKKLVISQIVKKNMMENAMPHIVSLKQTLESRRSPLLRDLMNFLREILKDCKVEIREILATDPQLASEIDYELRRLEKQDKRGRIQLSDLDLDNTPRRNVLDVQSAPAGANLVPPAQVRVTPARSMQAAGGNISPATANNINAANTPPSSRIIGTRETGRDAANATPSPKTPFSNIPCPDWITTSVRKAQKEAQRVVNRSNLSPRQKEILRASDGPGTSKQRTSTKTPPPNTLLRMHLLKQILEQTEGLSLSQNQEGLHGKEPRLSAEIDQRERFLQRAISTPTRAVENVSFEMTDEPSAIETTHVYEPGT